MAEYQLIPIHLGRLYVDKGIMTYRCNYGVKAWMPIISWYIKGADGHILVDSGISAEEGKWYTDTPIEDTVSFEEGLDSLGLKPDDISMVIQTHLHFDHVGNTHRCPNAEVVVQRAELEFAMAPHPMQGYLYNPQALNPLHIRMVEGDTEILPGIELIHLPSHTPGTQAVSVKTSQGRAVISGMCCIGENFNPPRPQTWPQERHFWEVTPPGNYINLQEAFFNTLRLKHLADIIIPQHDPSLFEVTKIPA